MQHHLPEALELQKILHIRPVGPGRQHKMQQNARCSGCRCRTCLTATPSCNRCHLLQHCKLHPSGWDRNYKLLCAESWAAWQAAGKWQTPGHRGMFHVPPQVFQSWLFQHEALHWIPFGATFSRGLVRGSQRWSGRFVCIHFDFITHSKRKYIWWVFMFSRGNHSHE